MNTAPSFTGPDNIGHPVMFTIKESAEFGVDLTGSQSRLVYLDLPSNDPAPLRPDISLAGKKLGWEPTINLREGLERAIESIRELVDNN